MVIDVNAVEFQIAFAVLLVALEGFIEHGLITRVLFALSLVDAVGPRLEGCVQPDAQVSVHQPRSEACTHDNAVTECRADEFEVRQIIKDGIGWGLGMEVLKTHGQFRGQVSERVVDNAQVEGIANIAGSRRVTASAVTRDSDLHAGTPTVGFLRVMAHSPARLQPIHLWVVAQQSGRRGRGLVFDPPCGCTSEVHVKELCLEDVRRIADLSMLRLKDSEAEAMRHQLNKILEAFEALDRLPFKTEPSLDPRSGVLFDEVLARGEDVSRARLDAPLEALCETESLLQVFPRSEDSLLVVPQVIERETQA